MSVFENKVLLITGGTGSFGNAVLRRFLTSDIKEIRIFSRDEKKQDDMRHHLQAAYPEAASKVKFYIGDVRNRESVNVAMRGVDYVFAAAALKQVPSCEFFQYDIDGEKVYLPSPNLHALFLVRHTMLHFASTSVTLRQLLDWGFFVEKNSSKIDWNWLVSVMNTYNMTAFFDYMNEICVSDLGFAETDYPYVKHGLKFKERILSDIITPEFQDYEPEGALSQIVFRWRRRRANAWKREICYGDEGLRSLLVSIKSHLISPKC